MPQPVLAIFWAIVYEKTRDIGILRTSASCSNRLDLSALWSRGGCDWRGMFGLGLGWLITVNVNGIHDVLAQPPAWLAWGLAALTAAILIWTIITLFSGRILPVVLGIMGTGILGLFTTLVFILDASGGVVIWDPAVYYFSEVPNSIELPSGLVTMAGAFIFSLIGPGNKQLRRVAECDPVKGVPALTAIMSRTSQFSKRPICTRPIAWERSTFPCSGGVHLRVRRCRRRMSAQQRFEIEAPSASSWRTGPRSRTGGHTF